MSDESVRAALRLDASLVIIEAPAGCGKTYQGAEYVAEMAGGSRSTRVLVLTHTHAACSAFAARVGRGPIPSADIRTIDGFLTELACVYHAGMGLPADVAGWLRLNKNGHAEVAKRVAALLAKHPMVAEAVALRYPVVVCDEHQDSTSDQHAAVLTLLAAGAKVRLFADPMQRIYTSSSASAGAPGWDWDELVRRADAVEELQIPHRWKRDAPELGELVLRWRADLKAGGTLDLSGSLPACVKVIRADSEAAGRLEFRVARADRGPVDAFERLQESLLVLTRYNDAARGFRGFFNRRLPVWEGHGRDALERLVTSVLDAGGDSLRVAHGVVGFLEQVAKGLSKSAFGRAFTEEVRTGCSLRRRGRPFVIQGMAKHLLAEPNHKGVARVLRQAMKLSEAEKGFDDVAFDLIQECRDAIRLEEFDSPDTGLLEIKSRRAHSYPRPPGRAISTIHKAKGLECASTLVMPCDSRCFPDQSEARCLLYVALSRAMRHLALVVPRTTPSPLLTV